MTELVDTVRDCVEGAILEVLDCLGHIDDEWVDVGDADVQTGNRFGLESADQNAVDQLDDFRGSGTVVGTWTDLSGGESGQKTHGESSSHLVSCCFRF